MSEPPPSPLEINAFRPRNDQKSYRPCAPSLGSHVARENSSGVRGNDPGGHGFPRSSRQTFTPASARRYPITDPPNPEPTTTASKASSARNLGGHLRLLRREDAGELGARAKPQLRVRGAEPLLDRLRRQEELCGSLLVRRPA